MYKMSGIQINSEWINEINGIQSNDASEDESHEEQQELNNQNDDSDHFSEVDETDLHVGNTDTLFDEIADDSHLIGDKEYVFAPGEGQHPLSLYSDPDAEYLAFPTIFCG